MRKSIYGQLVLSFICVFIVSNILASTISFFSMEINTLDQLGKQLTESVVIVKEEYEKGNTSIETIEKLSKDNYITINFIEDIEEYGVKKEKMSLLEAGKTLALRTNELGNTSVSTPIAITKSGDCLY